MPDGSVYERKRRTALYVGVGASIEPIVFGGYFLPVFSYVYEGEWYMVNLGLPLTAIAIYPHLQHRFIIRWGFQGRADFAYEYKPTKADTIRLEYIQTFEDYRLSDEAKADSYGGARRQVTYAQEWFRLSYTHVVGMIEIGASAAYMPIGYYFKGKYFHTSPSRELEDTIELGLSLKATL
jgi:hypothetical protein